MMAGEASELFAAVKRNDRAAVERLADADPSLLDEREDGVTPLLVAYYHGKSEIAELLRRRRPPRDIFEAATAGDLRRVRELVERDRSLSNEVSPDGYSPLGLAAFFKRRVVVAYLLERSADPKAASRDQGFTPLHSAVASDAGASDAEIVRMLLEAGADPNARSRQGTTPVHTAAFTGDRAVLDLLLAHGADTGIRSVDGKTPSEIAHERGNQGIVDLLATRARAG
jgi:ankyrin repeat protein